MSETTIHHSRSSRLLLLPRAHVFVSSFVLCSAVLSLAAASAEEPIFADGAQLKVEVDNGSGGDGPAWHPELGLLPSGVDGHIDQLDRDRRSTIFCRAAGTSGLRFDQRGHASGNGGGPSLGASLDVGAGVGLGAAHV